MLRPAISGISLWLEYNAEGEGEETIAIAADVYLIKHIFAVKLSSSSVLETI